MGDVLESILKQNNTISRLNNNHSYLSVDKAYKDNEHIKVSIVCTCFNHEKYIEKCIEGFLMQKVDFNVEVIIHDDASTDKSVEIIKKFQDKYPKIIKTIFQKENQYSQGVPIGKKYIAPLINGQYVATCEGDDYWFDPYKLMMQVKFMDENPDYTLCTHDTMIFNNRTKNFERKYANYNTDCDIPLDDAMIWGPTHKAHYSSWLVKREYYVINNNIPFLTKYKSVGDHPKLIYHTLYGKVKFLNLTMSVYNMFSCDTSWRTRTFSSPESEIQMHKNKIKMLESLRDEVELDEIHKKLAEKLILRDLFYIARMENDYKTIFSKEMSSVYNELSMKNKFKLVLKRCLQAVYKK